MSEFNPREAQARQRQIDRERAEERKRTRKATSMGGGKPLRLRFANPKGAARKQRASRNAGSWTATGKQVGLLVKIHQGGRAGDGYSERQTGAELLETNMLGRTAAERAEEFHLDECRHPRSRPDKLFVHLSLSRPAGRDLTPAQWRAVAKSFLREIGAEGCSFVLIRHSNTGNDHVHLVFSRATPTGGLVNTGQNFYRWRAAARVVEEELGLKIPESPATQRPAAPTDAATSAQRRAIRRGTTDPWIDPGEIEKVLVDTQDPDQFARALSRRGIELQITRRSDGSASGVLLRRKGADEWLAGGSIRRDLTLPSIQRRLLLNQQQAAMRAQQGRQATQYQTHNPHPRDRG